MAAPRPARRRRRASGPRRRQVRDPALGLLLQAEVQLAAIADQRAGAAQIERDRLLVVVDAIEVGAGPQLRRRGRAIKLALGLLSRQVVGRRQQRCRPATGCPGTRTPLRAAGRAAGPARRPPPTSAAASSRLMITTGTAGPAAQLRMRRRSAGCRTASQRRQADRRPQRRGNPQQRARSRLRSSWRGVSPGEQAERREQRQDVGHELGLGEAEEDEAEHGHSDSSSVGPPSAAPGSHAARQQRRAIAGSSGVQGMKPSSSTGTKNQSGS